METARKNPRFRATRAIFSRLHYEGQVSRIFILALGFALRPDTLQQSDKLASPRSGASSQQARLKGALRHQTRNGLPSLTLRLRPYCGGGRTDVACDT